MLSSDKLIRFTNSIQSHHALLSKAILLTRPPFEDFTHNSPTTSSPMSCLPTSAGIPMQPDLCCTQACCPAACTPGAPWTHCHPSSSMDPLLPQQLHGPTATPAAPWAHCYPSGSMDPLLPQQPRTPVQLLESTAALDRSSLTSAANASGPTLSNANAAAWSTC